jgi:hypothetical protein
MDGIQRGIELVGEILGQDTQHVAAVLLEQSVFPVIATVGGGPARWHLSTPRDRQMVEGQRTYHLA